jgi:hypothetical protein
MLKRERRLWFLGKPLPVSVDFWVSLGVDAREYVDLKRHGPEQREEQAHKLVRKWRAAVVADRCTATDAAADRGKELVQLFLIHGGTPGWRRRLAELGVSPRTAQNLRRLHELRVLAPRLYDRLRALGPTKCYRIAHMTIDEWQTMDPDKVVKFGSLEVKIAHLSDEQLGAYLRTNYPVAKRPRWARLRTEIHLLQKHLTQMPSGEPVEPSELVELQSAATSVVRQLIVFVKQAS